MGPKKAESYLGSSTFVKVAPLFYTICNWMSEEHFEVKMLSKVSGKLWSPC